MIAARHSKSVEAAGTAIFFSGCPVMQGPAASVAQAPTSSAPNSNIAGGVVALAAVGLAAAAATNSQQQGTGSGGMPEAGSPTPSPGGAGTSGLLHKPICTQQSALQHVMV